MSTNVYINRREDSIDKYLEEVRKVPVINANDQRKLLIKAKNGCEKSRELLVKCNLRFVISTAKKYYSYNVAFSDLISEGNMGLLKAIEEYDLDKEVNFISYAVYWVRYHIIEYIKNKSRTIRLPNSVIALIEKNKKGDNLTKKEKRTLKMVTDCTSYDEYLNDETDTTFINTIEDDNVIESDSNYDTTFIKNKITDLMSDLTEQERFVINHSYGLNNFKEETIGYMSHKLSVSNEKVRIIRNNAIKKMRENGYDLFEFF